MGLFEQFPYSNFHSINLDWIIEKVKTTLESAVMSVNGQTGEVILYQSENVVFPDVQSDQWRMVRTAAGHTAGVLFNQDYMYVMYDNVADRVYTMNHPQIIFPDAATRLPDVTEDYTNIRRQIETNGTPNIVGIELKQNKAYRMKDNSRYEIYDNGNPPPYPVTSVNGNTGAIVIAIPFLDIEADDIIFSEPASAHYWSLGRETVDGTADIQVITNSTKAEAYIDFYDGEGLSYTKKLLTTDDIPSSSGVVSINGQAGVVTIYGDTMPIESGSADSVKDVTDNLKSDIAIVEDTDTATHDITAGYYVIWKGALYTALSNIAIGNTLSSANLSTVPSGGLNALNSNMQKFLFRRMKGVPANGSATFTFPSYTECAIIFSAISNTNGFIYIYANGYLFPVKTPTGATLTVSSDYKTITVANSTSSSIYVACVSCVNQAT